MTTGPSNVALAGHALALVGYLLLAGWSWQGRARGMVRTASSRALLAAALCSAAWAGLGLAVEIWRSAALASAEQLLDVLRQGGWFLFLLLALQGPVCCRNRRSLLMIGALLVVAAIVPQSLAPAATTPSVWLRVQLFAALSLSIFGLLLVEQLYRNVDQGARWGVKPVGLGLGGVFVFDLYLHSQALLFGRADPDALALRPAVHAVAVPLLLVATRRQKGWTRELRLSLGVAFHTATLLLTGAYLLFISAAGYWVREFGGDWGSTLQIGLGVLALLGLAGLLLSGTLRSRLRVFVSKHFFRYRYDYRAEWLRFTAMLSASPSAQDLGALTVYGLADLVESPAGTLWTATDDGAAYFPAARWNGPPMIGSEPADSHFVALLRDRGWIVDVDEWRRDLQRYDGLELPAWLTGHDDAWLVVPLPAQDQLTGFVVLARPRTEFPVNWEVRDLLKTAARQAGAFIAQMRAAEALLEARKFEAFNRMSAFVVHDLKNIVTQLSLMMKNARRLHANPEFQQDMLATVENALEKMRQLMTQLREGEAGADERWGVELAALARRLQADARSRGRELELQLADPAHTRGRADRLERVLGHLVHNALDATATDGGRVWLRVERAVGQALVTVGDEGCGMSPEFVSTRLFRPFSSTKSAGMGIGSYESAQYVRELGGRIEVESTPGQGTQVRVQLPLAETQHAAPVAMEDR